MLELPKTPDFRKVGSVLLKACAGIGNLVLLTPLLNTCLELGLRTMFCPISDLDGASLASLFRNSSSRLQLVAPSEVLDIPADLILNVEAHKFAGQDDFHHNPYRIGISGHEPGFAAKFFENITGVSVDISRTFVGGNPDDVPAGLRNRVIVCPGSKSGWDSKRWPHMDDLLRRLDKPVVLCRDADLRAYRDLEFLTAITAPNATRMTDLTLFQAASLLRTASMVIANDCGMAHVAAATGVPTFILFGPSSLEKNRHPRTNVLSLSLGLDCQPCQGANSGPGQLGSGAYSCIRGYRCLAELTVEKVLAALAALTSAPQTTYNPLRS
jgi:hypothetical protein